MYGIYANKTGVFVDGKCGSILMAYIHGSVMGMKSNSLLLFFLGFVGDYGGLDRFTLELLGTW